MHITPRSLMVHSPDSPSSTYRKTWLPPISNVDGSTSTSCTPASSLVGDGLASLLCDAAVGAGAAPWSVPTSPHETRSRPVAPTSAAADERRGFGIVPMPIGCHDFSAAAGRGQVPHRDSPWKRDAVAAPAFQGDFRFRRHSISEVGEGRMTWFDPRDQRTEPNRLLIPHDVVDGGR